MGATTRSSKRRSNADMIDPKSPTKLVSQRLSAAKVIKQSNSPVMIVPSPQKLSASGYSS